MISSCPCLPPGVSVRVWNYPVKITNLISYSQSNSANKKQKFCFNKTKKEHKSYKEFKDVYVYAAPLKC
jgi:hypothetical protein